MVVPVSAAADLTPIPQLIPLLPPGRGSERIHGSTLLRWILKGIRGPDGQRVRLRAVRVGSRWMSSSAWLGEFFEALTPVFRDADAAPAPRTPTARQRASQRAAEALQAAGI
jgi:hypothetical protein